MDIYLKTTAPGYTRLNADFVTANPLEIPSLTVRNAPGHDLKVDVGSLRLYGTGMPGGLAGAADTVEVFRPKGLPDSLIDLGALRYGKLKITVE